MKLSFFFMLICSTAFSASIFSQTKSLTLDIENASIKDVFKVIEDQSPYRFFYNDELNELNKTVDMSVRELSIEDILNQLFTDSETSYTVMENNLVVIAPKRVLQQEKVKGVVTDATSGEPIPGVYVRVKGTNSGGITDVNGSYSVNISNNEDVLSFSFIGYKSLEMPVAGRTVIDIALEPEIEALEEVVVVGYGTQKKVTVTGAITTLGDDEVSLTPTTNLTQGLAGTLSGVIINQRGGEPGEEDTEIYIRGISTTEDASPLYVIDGIVRDYQGMDRIDASEVESITVLKDASAAIYGSRAANGVILITTKRGKVGKPTLQFTYNHGFSQPTRLPKQASSGQYAEACNLRNYMLGYGEYYTYSEEEVQKFYDGSDPVNYPNTDWYDWVYDDWKNQDKVNLSVNGGSEAVKYFVSGGYQYQGTPFDYGFTYNKQYNIRSNIDASINDYLTVSLDLSGRLDDILSSNLDYNHVLLGYPYVNPLNPDGSYAQGRSGMNAVQMVRDKEFGYTSYDRGVLTSSLSAKWDLPWVEGLSLTGTFAYDYNKNYQKVYEGVTYWYEYDSATETYTKNTGSNAASPMLNVDFAQGRSITANMRLAYIRSFGEHNIDAFVGYEQNTTHDDALSAGRSEFLSGAIHELFAGTADQTLQSSDGSASNTARQHVFGRVAYDFAKKYLVQFQLRYDGSQNFASDKRWGLFPGVSAGWTLSEESFMDGFTFLSYMKLRGSWGQLGNDNVDAYQYLTSYEYGDNASFGGTTAQGLVQSGVANPNITWEVATTYDIGLEARFWGQALGIDIDFFKTRRNNILATRNASVPYYTGLELPDENIGIVENKGIEIMATHRGSIGEVDYSIAGNFTYAKNTVIDIDEEPNAEAYQDQTGKPVGASLLYEIDYDYSGGIFDSDDEATAYGAILSETGAGHLVRKDMNNDGEINSLDQVRQDWTSTPEIVFGINTNFSYKGFELSLNFQGQARARIPGLQSYVYDPISWGNFSAWLAEDGWTTDNTDGSKPRPGLTSTQTITNTTYRYFNSAFIRLKNAELAYNLPKELISKIHVDAARVYISGYNLFSIDALKDLNIDPETTSLSTVPPDRIFNLGISLTF